MFGFPIFVFFESASLLFPFGLSIFGYPCLHLGIFAKVLSISGIPIFRPDQEPEEPVDEEEAFMRAGLAEVGLFQKGKMIRGKVG